MLRLLLLSLLPSLLAAAFLYDIKDEVASQIYSCDDSNSNNAYIYCYGKLLEAVNYHEIYNDSKTFVDMPMVNSPNVTLDAFNTAFPMATEDINPDDLKAFLNQYFTAAGSELQPCDDLSDWNENPPKFSSIADPDLRNWAKQLNNVWKQLCRKMDPKINGNIDKYSLIYVPNQFIIPGGRFREFYYWDAYWIVKGLLVSNMYQSVKNMITNLAGMVDQYGFVPNGGRVYYLKRSQPPLLSGMVYEYFEATQDIDFVKSMLPTLVKEMDFWKKQRMMIVTQSGVEYSVYQYHTPVNMPRAESYDDDMKKADGVADKSSFWNSVASAAESGWDFSSRWFADKTTFQQIETTKIAPVDLNSFICWNMDILEYLFEKTGDFTNANTYRDLRTAFRDTVTKVFYNESDGTWYDFNTRTGKHNGGFYPSMAVPLFTNCYNTLDQLKSEKLYAYMQNSNVFNYSSGVPTSILQAANQQWDFPNGWSPLNHMIIEGLRKSQNPQMQDQAYNIAKKWVLGNYRVWKETGHMWEKYNVIGNVPAPGSGGEYDVQDGFGWTNGVILDLLYTYGDRLTVPDDLKMVTTNRVGDSSAQTTQMRMTRSSDLDTTTTAGGGQDSVFGGIMFTLIVIFVSHFL